MRKLLLIAAAMVLVSACGGAAEELAERVVEAGGGEAEINIEDDSVSVSFESEDLSFQSGSNVELPDGLTFPIPDGGNVTTAGVQGSYVAVAVQFPKDRFDSVASYYDDWTSGDARDWQRSESTSAMGDDTIRNVTWNAGASLISVNDCISTATAMDGGSAFDAACLTVNEST